MPRRSELGTELRELEDAIARAVVGGDTGEEPACAKVNLALHVLSRRRDGYHLIDSLAVFTEFCDYLHVTSSAGDSLELVLDGPFATELDLLSRPDENLVLRSAEALRRTAKKRGASPTRIKLTKHIPLAAGLGGGSADAAATLRLLNRHWSLNLSDQKLTKIGLGLGADIPMCQLSKPVVAGGIGEKLSPATGIPRLPMVLANACVPLSTASVYARLEDAERTALPPLPERFSSMVSFVIWLRQTRNDLTEPASAETGLAMEAVNALSSDPDCIFARMSGSGATAFGIFPKFSNAESAARKLRQQRPNWWVVATETGGS